jgi:uncharacterized protein
MTAPREVLLAVLRYEVAAGGAARLPEVYPRHRAYLDVFARSGDLLLIGTFEDPAVNGSQAVFRSREAAERFVEQDPFVLEGLVVPTVLVWNALDFTSAH